jgi:hypothetical protein
MLVPPANILWCPRSWCEQMQPLTIQEDRWICHKQPISCRTSRHIQSHTHNLKKESIGNKMKTLWVIMARGKFQGTIVPTTPTGCAHQSSPVRLNLSNKLCSNFPLQAPQMLECHPNDFDAFSIGQEKGIIVHPLVCTLMQLSTSLAIPARPIDRFGDWPLCARAWHDFYWGAYYSDVSLQMEDPWSEEVTN